MESSSYIFPGPQDHIILPGQIPGAFGKVLIGDHHGLICLIISHGGRCFLDSRDANVPVVPLGLYYDAFSPFLQDKICSIVMAGFRKPDPVAQPTELNIKIFFKSLPA